MDGLLTIGVVVPVEGPGVVVPVGPVVIGDVGVVPDRLQNERFVFTLESVMLKQLHCIICEKVPNKLWIDKY